MKKIELPSNITTIGDYAFSDNSALTEVISQANPQNLGKNVFEIENKDLTLTVLKGTSLEKYAKENNTKYNTIENDIVTAIIDIVDKNGASQPRMGGADDLYSFIGLPKGSNYGECYYQLYFEEYVGNTLSVEGLGTFTYEKKEDVGMQNEQYIYKCKITNPEMFYKAGTHEYSVTYTVEKTNKTYTTKFEIEVNGFEIKTYKVKADKKIGISLTGAMGDKNNLKVDTIDKQDATYVEMVSKLSLNRENVDIYAYDINVEGEYEGELTLTFDVGEEYNGKKANILHMKDHFIEKFEATVENGKVTVTVTELSPFMIAIENTSVKTEKTT